MEMDIAMQQSDAMSHFSWLGKKGKTQKYGANAPQLHAIWPQAAPGAMRQHLFPLSIKDGEGARG
jgi:hypothetical protein